MSIEYYSRVEIIADDPHANNEFLQDRFKGAHLWPSSFCRVDPQTAPQLASP